MKMKESELINIYLVDICNRISIFDRQIEQGCHISIICWLQLEEQLAWR